jgi:hypothetical protein
MSAVQIFFTGDGKEALVNAHTFPGFSSHSSKPHIRRLRKIVKNWMVFMNVSYAPAAQLLAQVIGGTVINI